VKAWVGLYECTCRIFGSSSLKDKRRVLKSIKTKLKNRYNLSVAEVGHQDSWQLAKLAFAAVGSQKEIVERELRRGSRFIESTSDIEILDDHVTIV
jgi:uncharacterized protein